MNFIDLSFELFPPKTFNGLKNLNILLIKLLKLNPKFISITSGINNIIQNNTLNTILKIKHNNFKIIPHISCTGFSKKKLKILLNEYCSYNIHDIIVLRGDFLNKNKLNNTDIYYAYEFINFIKLEFGNWFNIKIAAYPEYHPIAKTPYHDIKNFIKKINSGANSAITQYFFNSDSYFYFIDNLYKLGVDIPIIPGIMPITNYLQLSYFSKICGTDMPKWVISKLETFKNNKNSIYSFGLDITINLCNKLIEAKVPGLHFYTLNNFIIIKHIYNILGYNLI